MSEFSTNKLGLFPEKLAALRSSHAKGEMDTTYPISVELSLTDACSFNCEWCSDFDLRKRLNGHMNNKIVPGLLDDLSDGGAKGVVIEGGGEPTLHPNICEIIEEVRKRGLACGLITNGARFNYSDQIDELEWVRISLDVANAEQMQTLKRKDAFETVMSNISEIARVKRQTVLGISYILTKKSRDGLEDLVYRLSRMGVNYFQVKPVVDHPELLWMGEKEDLKHLNAYESENFKVFLDALQTNRIRGNMGVSCVAHSLTSVIAANGDVFFCGRLNSDASWPALGNINRNSFKEIWTGEERRRQHELMMQATECSSKCPECRLTKFNVSLDQIQETPITVKTPNFI
ncbi:radical SAM protein [Patescibacteria group bacterium]|nr:radical SAM protein [Patescibacteria group bacterium]